MLEVSMRRILAGRPGRRGASEDVREPDSSGVTARMTPYGYPDRRPDHRGRRCPGDPGARDVDDPEPLGIVQVRTRRRISAGFATLDDLGPAYRAFDRPGLPPTPQARLRTRTENLFITSWSFAGQLPSLAAVQFF